MEVADWLGRIGLPQYAKAFADNAIDAGILQQLTAEDLKELGVSLLGHRRKLLTAIEGLRSQAEPSSLAKQNEERSAIDGLPGISPERRHLTVLFCDLVGSTALAARLDPEDLRDVIRRYHALVAEAVRAEEGFVAQYLGDGALVYFGFPVAGEDDAERAVRAAILLREAVQALEVDGKRLQVRSGLATGLVVAGDRAEGSKASHEQQIMGETPNRAARLQTLAEPGEIVIDAGTRKLIGRIFDLAERKPAELKGFATPVECWDVLGVSQVESRFEALRSGETPLIGRDEELELLERRWQQIRAGAGRVVLISGEAGLGKSRLVSAFEQRIKGDNALELRYFCSPQHANTALHPITTHLMRAANFSPSDTPEQKLEKLGALAAKPEDIPFIADLLSLRAGSDDRLDRFAPEEKRQKTFAALLARIDQLATETSLLILFEDLHWADATTQELIDILVASIARKSILIVMTHRPQFRPAWTGQANVTSMSLNRLRFEDRAALIRSLAGNIALSGETVEAIAERTDGIPLFAEELTKALMESGDIGLLRAAPNPADHIPATLHASLMARLDHLGTQARETAQLGSVIGREFPYSVLKALAIRTRAAAEGVLDQTLKGLTDAALIISRGTRPWSTYTFKHALVHDAAHATLLRAQRQKLHAAVTEILSADARTPPEVLAYHFSEAGEHEKAARQYLLAARRCNEQSAVREALQNLDQADRALRLVPKSEITEAVQLEIEAERIQPTVMHAGFGSKEARAVLDRAETLAEQLGANKPLLLLFHRYMDHVSRSDLKTGLALGLEFSERTSREWRIISHRLLGNCFMCLARFPDALSHFEAILAEEPSHSAKLRYSYLYDSRAFAFINMSLTLLLMGFPDQAERCRERAFAREKELAHPVTTVWVLSVGLIQPVLLDDRASIGILSARLSEHAQKFKMIHYNRHARVSIAYLAALAGDGEAALADIEACLSEWSEAGYRYLLPVVWIIQIRALLLCEKVDEAFAAVKRALSHVAETGEEIFAAELHRLDGIIALAASLGRDEASAEQAFRSAINIARAQDAKLFELRATTSLARLWRDQGKASEAERLLAPTYDWFAEGFATPDLLEANTVLAECRAP
ncbi:MAG: AAA family ATPase [Methylobacteriaceae bacterium]|nr:AAA family ATPase [Methylobacteriaceae bacterium]